MGLKQSIVVVNEYTIRTGDKGGSRGGTPGDYVLRYMSRDLATEHITPAKLQDVDTYIEKYMVRESAVESAESVPELKHKMGRAQKRGGIAFGYGEAALSDEKLHAASRDIQANFDRGKTVFKTILSFTEEYLKEHGILDEDFTLQHAGDYRGHLDQLKLRLAVMNGISKLSRQYDDLQYVGVIQVDTKHVHVHLAMVDRGVGNLMPDGTQRGKITESGKRLLRRGVDTYLDRKQSVRMMSSSVLYDKQNALCYIKKFTHKAMLQQGFPQFLLACLPEDRNLWRAGTHRKEMKKANAIVREYVVELLSRQGSGYREAMQDVTRYADYRTRREDLSEQMHDRLVRIGQSDLIESCMNGVYGVLRQIPRSELVVRTPMLSAMSMDYEAMAAEAVNDPMMEFGFRLRSYSSRIAHHRKEYHKYRDEYRSYEAAKDKSEDARALGDYLRIEQDYNRMLMVKYQYFLSFLPPDEDMEEDFEALVLEKKRLLNLERMRDDVSFSRMEPEQAERYGREVYGQYGGRRIRSMPQLLDRRIEDQSRKVARMTQSFRDRLSDYGLSYDGTGITRKKSYPFDQVKALDLHHLGYDFPYDFMVSKPNVDAFREMADRRYHGFQAAKDYLVRSGQEAAVRILPERDVLFMKEFADKLAVSPSFSSVRPSSGGRRRVPKTVRLGTDYVTDIHTAVKSMIASVHLDVSDFE